MELPYAPQTFDALILSEVLEHLVDPEKTLRRLVLLARSERPCLQARRTSPTGAF